MRCHGGVTARPSWWAHGGRVAAAAEDACGSEMTSAGPVPPDGERGALSLMIVVLFVALIALAGIVVDGGAKLAAYQNAEALAQEAARAGATSVDVSRAYGTGSFVVDPGLAASAADSYLNAADSYLKSPGNNTYSVSTIGIRAIEVSVTITEPTRFLSIIGLPSFTVRRSATASLVTGVTGGT
jgi:Flp pilus assembly protein TadG